MRQAAQIEDAVERLGGRVCGSCYFCMPVGVKYAKRNRLTRDHGFCVASAGTKGIDPLTLVKDRCDDACERWVAR